MTENVFIVHGHDENMREEVASFIRDIGYLPIVLHERPNLGRTIIEKFEEEAESIGFAIVLLSPDDFGAESAGSESYPRARQNVILELGYFLAKLGRNRVCPLYKGDVELPSDILGVLYIPFDSDGAWKFNVLREMEAAKLPAKTSPELSIEVKEADKAIQMLMLPNLKMPKTELEEKLKKQIEAGRGLARTRIRTIAGLKPAQVTHDHWNTYNVELLTRGFDSPSLAEQYRASTFTPNATYQRASRGKAIMRSEIEHGIRFLTSILQRLELLPDLNTSDSKLE